MDKKAADKKAARLRRGLRARHKIRELGVHRLCVHRTPTHIYAQLISPAPTGDRTLAAASTLEPALRQRGARCHFDSVQLRRFTCQPIG